MVQTSFSSPISLSQSNKVVAIRQVASSLPPLELSFEQILHEAAIGVIHQRAVDEGKAKQAILEQEIRGKMSTARRQLARDAGGLTPDERDELRAKVLNWEIEREWVPEFFVAVCSEERCQTCYGVSSHVIGIYQKQHRRTTNCDRFVLWAPEKATIDTLPRKVYTYHKTVPQCPQCLWVNGYTDQYTGELIP